MKRLYITLLLTILFSSCLKRNDIKDSSKVVVRNIKNHTAQIKTNNSADLQDDCTIDSLESQTSEYDGIKFYTENKLRGEGVLSISINQKVEILNLDKTVFGNISLIENDDETLYKIDLPKKTIVRQIIPDIEIQVFSFDAEFPETDKDFVIVYVNREKKLINKKNIKYTFMLWEKYIKSSFIELTPNVENISIEEKNYWYQALQIKGDSMKIKSIKTSCEYVENYKDFTTWIKWKKGSCMLIKFNFCY
ncbi:hypothetical protein [Flavobacterium sp.]|uniref:hypothetical protein n=1 Tax=Flavobacterium sp. TaxID=239 RepID=UPI00374C9035